MSLLEPESAESVEVERILAMTPEELYELSDEERQKLWSAVWGNSSASREAQTLLRVRQELDTFEIKLQELSGYPLSNNLHESEPENIQYCEIVRGFLERLVGLFSQYKKDFSNTELEKFQETLGQSFRQKRIYEGDIDRASSMLLTSFSWKDNPDFAHVADEICRGMTYTHTYVDSEHDWPARFFGDYVSGTIDFSEFQARLGAYNESQEEILDAMRSNMVKTILKIHQILRSGKPYDETEFYSSPYEMPHEEILQKHNQLLRYKNILALDEPALRAQLEPLIYMYSGDISREQ